MNSTGLQVSPLTSDARPPLVAHIIYSLKTGGLENGLVNIINRMPAERYRHAIICLTEAGDFARRITAPGVEIITLQKRAGHDLDLYRRLFRVLRKLKPAIVHTRNLACLEMQFISLLLPGTRRVHGEHGRDVYDLEGKNFRYNLLRKLVALIVHRYIAVSRDLAEWLKTTVNISASKVCQIYNGVDLEKFSPCPATGDIVLPAPAGFFVGNCVVVGTVGRLAAVKNQAALIQAFALATEKMPDLRSSLRLLIVGDGPTRGELEQDVARLGLNDLVWMPGDSDDIPALLRRMDIFVLPSLGEGISNTILEAMASGLPVIATAVGGNPELVEHGKNGLLVPVGDVQALADAILSLVADSARRVALGKNALQITRDQFDWRRTVAGYMGVYDQLLAGR